ncbi:MAG: RNA polymerase sigma factor [Candidatus Dormibacteria bacterium]
MPGEVYETWEHTYEDNAVRVYRRVFQRVGNRPDAEDLTGEIFLATMGRIRFPVAAGQARAYLAATTRTVLADFWRRHYGAPPEASSIDVDEISAVASGEADDADSAQARVEALLAELPPRFRQVLELRFLRGYSVAEIAREMSVTPGNARLLQFRALRRAAELGEPR